MDAKETLIRIVLPALLVYAAVCLASAQQELYRAEQAEASLRLSLETIEQDNLAVRAKLTEGWSAEELEQFARERLGLVLPGDRIFRFISDGRESPPAKQQHPAPPDQDRIETEREIHGLASRRNS
jgi:cell division protein FtsB